MPRRARTIKKNKLYHIMVQGINREYIFNETRNKEKYLKIMREKLENYQSIIIAYCMMDNHAHFLLHSENEGDVSKLFQRVNCAYSNYYNKERKRVGFVFRDRFLSKEIVDDIQKIRCIHYIHNNPIKAKIISNAEDYSYSSYHEYKNKRSNLIDFNIVNRLLDIKDILDYDNETEDYKDVAFNEELKEFDEAFFKSTYLTSIDVTKLKQCKDELKQEVRNCRFKMNVPVAVISKLFEIPDKTIYRWIKK